MKNTKTFACDFETSVYKGQTRTDVWSAAVCPIRTKLLQDNGVKEPGPEDVMIYHSLDEFMAWLDSMKRNPVLYFHNLKFDGSFILDWLLRNGYKWAEKEKRKDPDEPKTFSALIGDMGQWYQMTIIMPDGHAVYIRDSLKLMPMPLKKLAHDFKTKYQKLEMEYTGKRYPGCMIKPEERKYIANDVLVLSELMEIMFMAGIDTLTIGSACMKKYKETVPTMYIEENFMNLAAIEAPDYTGAKNADDYVRKSYRGGWCYAKPDRCNTVYYWKPTNHTAGAVYSFKGVDYIGVTADVNSLYPSMMHSMSGNRYPIGRPHFVKGADILKYKLPKYYTFIRLKCRFKLKEGFLPFIQIKGSQYYIGTEMLEDSRIRFRGNKYETLKIKETGKLITDVVEMTMTCTDYELFHKHYNVTDETILDGCWFYTDIGMFDDYINYWAHIKQASTGAQRQIAKLFLNNLYGKFATNPLNVVKIAVNAEHFDSYMHEHEKATIKDYLESSAAVGCSEDDDISLIDDYREDKKPMYIPIGSAITSYARQFTITAAQKNYDTFCYADTDSIHCLTSAEKIKGIKIHPTEFCCWKLESYWNEAIFVRAKTYIEHVSHEDGNPVSEQYYNVKCAGMPQKCKDMLIESFEETEEKAAGNKKIAEILIANDKEDTLKRDQMIEKYSFLGTKRNLTDFKIGLVVPGKLTPERIKGGVLLVERNFTMNARKY